MVALLEKAQARRRGRRRGRRRRAAVRPRARRAARDDGASCSPAATSTRGCSRRSHAATRRRRAAARPVHPAARPPGIAGAAARPASATGREPRGGRARPRGRRPPRARDRGAARARDPRARPRPATCSRRSRVRGSTCGSCGSAQPRSCSTAMAALRPLTADHAAAGVRRGAAEVEAGDGGARREAPVPHLVGQALALEDVAAGEPDARLDVGRRRAPRARLTQSATSGAKRAIASSTRVGDLVAPRVPGAVGERVRHVLGEHAHRVRRRAARSIGS